MKIIHAFLMTFSMFTHIPCPYHGWDEDARKYMMVMLPLIGAIIGGLWFLSYYLLSLISIPFIIKALVPTLITYFITGFIHFDGYMDVIDAIKSYRPLDERRRILKDSHVGSFAVVFAVIAILSMFAFFGVQKDNIEYLNLIFIPIASRVMSAFFVTVLKPMKESQYANLDKKNKTATIIILSVMLCISLFLEMFFLGMKGLSGVAVMLSHAFFTLIAYRKLDGMNGDISGYSITISEIIGVAVMVLI